MESNTNEESIENFSQLTYRQRFAIINYGYLLTPEDAEVAGQMLGNFQDKDVLTFCQAHGKKVKTVAPIRNPSLAKRSRNLGIGAMAMMIGITLINFSVPVQPDTPDWAITVFVLALFAALLISIIGFVMGIYALGEEIDRLTAILSLVLNGVAFLPLCFFTLLLVLSKG